MAIEIIARAEAKAQGLKRFNDGAPCKRQHTSERFVSDGQCVVCVYEKNASWAKRNVDKKSEYHRKWVSENVAHVKAYTKEYSARWYKANRAEKLAKSTEYNKKNPEITRRAAAKWQKANPEIVRAKAREWEKANPEKRQAISKRKYAARPDHYRAKNNKWARENPDKKAVVTHRRRAIKAAAEGSHTAAEVAAILKKQKHRCAYCPADLRKVKRHLDHIVPLARGGSNSASNLQWTCDFHNMAKGSRDPADFARSLGLLL